MTGGVSKQQYEQLIMWSLKFTLNLLENYDSHWRWDSPLTDHHVPVFKLCNNLTCGSQRKSRDPQQTEIKYQIPLNKIAGLEILEMKWWLNSSNKKAKNICSGVETKIKTTVQPLKRYQRCGGGVLACKKISVTSEMKKWGARVQKKISSSCSGLSGHYYQVKSQTLLLCSWSQFGFITMLF